MLKNYFKIALRQFRKQKMFTAIKIGGFAMSIAACLLIALFIQNELSYDRSYPDAERIYRVVAEFSDNGTIIRGVEFPAPMSKVLKADLPEIEQSARLMPNPLFTGAGSNELRLADINENTHEEGFTYADQEILDMLKIRMVYGDRVHALTEPNTMVMSKTKADKYFPGQNPVGKIMILNSDRNRPYKVSGVMQDFPATSHLEYDFLLTLAGVEFFPGEQASWNASNYVHYILLRPGTDIPKFEKKLTADILHNYFLPSQLKSGDINAEKVIKTASLYLQPVSDIHLKSNGIHDNLSHGDIRYIWLFGAIACFILILASINFINLSTAKSASRAKEVGLRKVVGSGRISLVKQFLTESIVVSFISFALGILLALELLPFFNMLSAKSLTLPRNEWWLVPFILLSAIITGLLAGLYPSFYLSAFKPISVLKGKISRGSKNSILRNGLVIFQFTTSIILIIGTLVIYSQMHFILNKKLGYDKEQVVLIKGTNTLYNEIKNFKNELLKLPQVETVSVSDYLPVAGTKRDVNYFWKEGKMKEERGVGSQIWKVDNDYIKTMGMKVVAGRNFSATIASDSQAVIINQTLADKLRLDEPIGKFITNGRGIFQVIGVLEDFHFESLRDNIDGLCMKLGHSTSIVSVKVNGADMANAMLSVSSAWKKFSPGQPIRYTFLDESFAGMYADVQRVGRIFTSFAILAIIIASLGLFALSAFMAEQRTKEIGIRKVLGASVSNIAAMLSKDFVKLVVIAIVIGSPIAWWAMSKWLEDFVYRVNISWWMFFAAGLSAVIIALVTVSFQAIKAAIANPAKSLRTE